MPNISCTTNQQCPFLFFCNTGTSICEHNPILPPSFYTMFVYLLLPVGIALANVGGLSAGIFKVPILMDMLDYTVSEATMLSYPITTGAALGNFLQLIPKRHPNKQTSLIDYNIVLVLLPSVIYGTTLGVIAVKLVPQLYQDILLMIIFTFFSFFFFKKWKLYEEVRQQSKLTTVTGRKSILTGDMSFRKSLIEIQLQQRDNSRDTRDIVVSPVFEILSRPRSGQPDTSVVVTLEDKKQLEQLLEYQKTHHVKDILVTLLVFGCFEVVSQLVQGKIIHFQMCSKSFYISFPIFTAMYISYVIMLYFFSKRNMQRYRRIGYDYDVKIDDIMSYFVIFGCSFGGGFMQGVVGIGSGTCIVTGLLFVKVNQKVASATSGFIVLFVGLASLIEAITEGELTAQEIGWFMGLSFIIGGILTLFMYRFVLARPGATKTVLLIVALLSVMSVLGTIPSIIITEKYYTWAELFRLDPFCK